MQGRPALRTPKFSCDSHIHIFETRFPARDGWVGEPVYDASVAKYRRLQARLGTSRAVVVTPSTYGTDNRATLDALKQFGNAARGVVVIDHEDPPLGLKAMSSMGVRGVRVNFVSPQPWGRTHSGRLVKTASIAADLGWHVQIYAKSDQIAEMSDVLARLPAPLVIDHLGSVEPGRRGGPGDGTVLRLLDRGRTWLKLSGAYIVSEAGSPSYHDLRPYAEAYVQAAPDRMLWGSDWPHRGQRGKMPDDADLLDLLLAWAPEPDLQRRILVDNPANLYGFS